MNTDTLLTIDFKDNISVPLLEYNNECKTLEDLANGLKALYATIKEGESKYLKQYPIHRGWRNDLQIEGMDKSFGILLPSYFHWYANSLITYVRLVGYLKARYHGYLTEIDLETAPNKLKSSSDEYLNSLPEIKAVLHWRNKVSAHLSITDAKRDLPHIIRQSVLQPISFWLNHRFTACTIEGEIDDRHPNFPQWSLTLIHEALSPRFWPDISQLTTNIKGFNVRNNNPAAPGEYWYSAQIDQIILTQEVPPNSVDDFRVSLRNG